MTPQPKPMRRCPKCFSDDVEMVEYMGVSCLVCRACGFDETTLYEVYPGEKGGGKGKARYTPYKAGGHRRTKI